MIVLTGASASGKTEVAKILIRKYRIEKVITHTTREKRVGETDGVDYHFVSKEEFKKMLAEDKFVEYMEYNGNFYGTSKAEVSDNKAVIVDPNGVKAFQNLHDKNIFIFRLLASETTRFNRMLVRGDDLDSIKVRISKDKSYFSEDKYSDVDYVIDTDTHTIEEVADKIIAYYRAHKA